MPHTVGVADHAAPEPLGLVETVDADAVEPKVTWATLSSAVAGLVVWLLSAYVFHGAVPDAVIGAVGVLVTTAATFTAGWLARHVDRKA
jgi:fatty acid desaturase